MGIEVAAGVMAAVAIGSEVGKSYEESSAATAQKQALDLQAKEMALQTQQKTLANYDTMEKTLQAQQAHMTITGTTMSSPSYNAIQRNTLNIGAKNLSNTALEGDIEQANIAAEKSNVNDTLYAELFGNAAEGASTAFTAASKMPTSSGASNAFGGV